MATEQPNSDTGERTEGKTCNDPSQDAHGGLLNDNGGPEWPSRRSVMITGLVNGQTYRTAW